MTYCCNECKNKECPVICRDRGREHMNKIREHERGRNEEKTEKRSWKIRFADGTVGIYCGTYDRAVAIADLRKDLYGGNCTIERR